MFEALIEARKGRNELDFWREDSPRCPHCGENFDVIDHEQWELVDPQNEEAEVECPWCQENFKVGISVQYKYSTDEADRY